MSENASTVDKTKVEETKKKVERSLKQELWSAERKYEALKKKVAQDKAKKRIKDVVFKMLDDIKVCEMIGAMSPMEAKVFGDCIAQNCQWLLDACAKERDKARQHDAAMAEKRKLAADDAKALKDEAGSGKLAF